MRYRNVLDRRTFLWGTGGVIVGLPLLDEMQATSAYAAAPAPPIRAFNVFFGLGFQRALQQEGFSAPNGWINPLAPLLEHEQKLAFLRGATLIRANGDGNAHMDGAAGAFTGTKLVNRNTTGGVSLDEALRRHSYPGGMPAGMLHSLLAGTWWRRSDSSTRYVHSRNPDGSMVDVPLETPKSLFHHIFGGLSSNDGKAKDPDEVRRQAMKASVLDSLVDQYKHYQSDAGNLGAASRAKIKDHLDHIRALETASTTTPSIKDGCTIPEEPPNSTLPHDSPLEGDGTELRNDGDGVDVDVDVLTKEFRLMADLYAMAVRCDRARFGSMVFQSAGERVRLKGDYTYGSTSHFFDDRGIRGQGGSHGCSHEWWHEFSDTGENRQVRAHLQLMMREISYFLGLLDDIGDENGQSVLDNALITISTESGDGRHKSAEFELDGVFHAISGANGLFKVGNGDYVDVAGEHATAIYNTLLRGFDVTELLGDGAGNVSALLA